MMNANRTSGAVEYLRRPAGFLPAGHGVDPVYVENGQEALDMIIQAYAVAENDAVYTPFMVNLDGYVNTHTYELVTIPAQSEVDEFLPPFKSKNAIDF